MCNGTCCENFPLKLPKAIIGRMVQRGDSANTTNLELRMIFDMIQSMDGGRPHLHGGKKYYRYRCRHHDQATNKCTIYEKRPVMCRTFPDKKGGDIVKCADSIPGGCSLVSGTPPKQAVSEFRVAHGLPEWTGNEL